MTDGLNQSALKALRIMESLFEDGFEGKTLDEVSQETGISRTTAWRLLNTMEAGGWVIETPVAGSKQGRWQVSTRLAGIADAYEQHALARAQRVKREFREVTGRELNA